MSALPVELPLDGGAAPPRSNGELVFAEPWESRVFGVTLSLHQAGYFEWPAFQTELIAAVGRWEAVHPPAPGAFRYYECWFEALQALLEGLGIVGLEELQTRVLEFEARPHGHDHDHVHDHP